MKTVIEVKDRKSGAAVRVTIEAVGGPVRESAVMFEDVVEDVAGPGGMEFWWTTIEEIEWTTDGVVVPDDERRPE